MPGCSYAPTMWPHPHVNGWNWETNKPLPEKPNDDAWKYKIKADGEYVDRQMQEGETYSDFDDGEPDLAEDIELLQDFPPMSIGLGPSAKLTPLIFYPHRQKESA